MAESITEAIEGLTDRVFAYRIARIINRGTTMPPLIEIKGLGAAVSLAKKGIADVRSATSGLSTEAAALVTAVNEVREQIKQAHSDLKFEAETLGNGGPETASDEPPKPPVTPPAGQQAEQGITAPVGFDMRPGAINQVDPQTVAVLPVGDQRTFDRMG